MSKKLLFGRTKKILLFFTLLFGVAASGILAQSAGDIAFIGYNGDESDEFAFISFVNISANTTIYFTDAPWDGGPTFPGNEGRITYQVPLGGVSAGDVIEINPSTESASDGGSVTESGYNFAGGGDELYAYLGSDEDTPTTFLFALTNETSWSSADGEVPSNLNEGTTALSGIGGSVDDNGEYVGVREGTVSTLKSEIQKVVNEWTTTDGSNDQSISFNTNSFSLFDPPTLAFNSSSASVDEDITSIDLTVELVESDGSDVSVDVAFLGSSSTADLSDINSYSTQTVSFTGSPTSGDTKKITVSLTDDNDFEGAQEAVFQLQNNSKGTIIAPGVMTLTINDDDVPDVVINEFLADPPDGNAGDANGDGTRHQDDDEFVEIVNNESTDIDISGWQLSDDGGSSITYTFPSGTVLPAGRAIVVFGGGEPTGNFGGSIIQITSSLSLSNSGGNVTLLDAAGITVEDISYGSEAGNNESITRDEDITGSFTGHTSADSEGDSSPFSPGTKIDGTPFGSDHAIAIRGTEGWRMISSPVQSATFSDILGGFWMQGVSGSDDPSGDGTIFSWAESSGGSFSPIGDMSNDLMAGKGYIVYFFEDDEFSTPGIQGGFPKIINSDGNENGNSVTISVSATDDGGSDGIDGNEGWNLLGNPFDTDILAAGIIDALESVNPDVNTNISVWDHETASWVVLDGKDGSDDTIAPFQAFFVRFTSAFSDNVSLDKSSLEANEGKEFYKNVDNNFQFDLELHGEEYFDRYSLEFTEDGKTELDRYDAYKLFSLSPNSVNLYSTQNNNMLQKNVLPSELEANLEIPLSFDASGRTSLTFRWGTFENIPDDWEIILIDNEMNREINLRTSEEYAFTLSGEKSEVNELASSSDKKGLLKKAEQDDGESRFALAVQPKIAGSDDSEIPESIKLNPNYPNPFNPSTTLSFELAEDSEVTLSIWNMIGQKVATLVEGMVEAGTHQHTWNASSMPSGMYIARLEVGGEVFTRKMTLIK